MEEDSISSSIALQRVECEYTDGNITGTERYQLRSGLRGLPGLKVSTSEFKQLCAGLRPEVPLVFADLFASASRTGSVR